MVLGAVGLVLAAAASIAAPPRAAPILEPVWTGPADISPYYPDRAQRLEISGWARLECEVTAMGRGQHCLVVGESPANFGFGLAAIKLSSRGQFSPIAGPGSLVGRTVVRTFNFKAGSHQIDEWMRQPTARQIHAVRPPGAEPFGMADVFCGRVTTDGALSECKVMSESPKGEGFGDAALSLSGQFRRAARAPPSPKVSTWIIWRQPGSNVVPIGMSAVLRRSGLTMSPLAFVGEERLARAQTAPEVFSRVPSPQEPRRGLRGGNIENVSVHLTCEVTPDGSMKGCVAAPNGRPDHRYEAAALSLAPMFKASAATLQQFFGQPAATYHVNFVP